MQILENVVLIIIISWLNLNLFTQSRVVDNFICSGEACQILKDNEKW